MAKEVIEQQALAGTPNLVNNALLVIYFYEGVATKL